MDNSKDGGPAFPVSEEAARGKVSAVYGGLSMRDYFAAKAMEGYVSRTNWECDSSTFDATVSKYAYEMADAMLRAREAT